VARKPPSRNAPCWCGSGKKYKKCHLNIDADAEAKHHTPPILHARDYGEILKGSQIRSFEIGPDRQ
jgi:hypothetical protein